jgi:hypothetical protein
MNLKVIRVVCILSLLLTVIWYVNAADAAKDFVTDGLVAMYTLNKSDLKGDVVMDAFGDNDAKLIGNLDFVEGQVGDALEFTAAADNYVEIPAMGMFDFASVECYALETQWSGIQGIVSTWAWVAGKVHFKFQGNQIQVDKNGGQKIVFAAETEKWYHIIYTTNPEDNELKLYVDGELVAEGVAGAQPENMDERRIGSEHNGRFLNGMIDNVRIYDRVLTEEEVMQNFGAKSDQLPVEPAEKLSTTWGALKRKRI